MIFVDKRYWPEFGIITCFLWIKGTGLSLVLLPVFLDKSPVLSSVLLRVFLWINGTVLNLVLLCNFCGYKALF